METTSESLSAAVEHHNAGRLDAAEQIYRQILVIYPNHADAWHLLGVLSSQRGNLQIAADYIRRAIEQDANQPAFYCNLGIALHELGHLDEAMASYRRALALSPEFADAHNNLGSILREQGKLDEATACFRRVLELAPGAVQAHNNLGNVLREQAKHDEAILCFRRALELNPGYAEAHNNLGNTFKEQGKLNEAIACYRRALEVRPQYVKAYNNLGAALADQGNFDEAIDWYRRALELKPDYANAHFNLGIALLEKDNPEAAIDSFRRALQLNPNFAEAHYNLGNALRDKHQRAEPIACYRRTLELMPRHAKAHNNLGTILQEQGKLEEALACYRGALDIKPDMAEAHSNLGNVLRELGKTAEAIICYRRALELKPNDPATYSNLGNSYRDLRQPDEAVAWFRRAVALRPGDVAATCSLAHELEHLCDWKELESLSRRVIEGVEAAGPGVLADPVSPFSFLTLPTVTTAEQQLRCARQCAAQHLKLPLEQTGNLAKNRAAGRKSKITVGYLSADYHAHATALLIAELFEKHDRERFSIVGYSYGPDDGSTMRRRLVKAFDRFVDVRNASFQEAAERIAADEVDVLVDLKGFTADTRSQILAYRPAPIQVNYLGYPGTMGAPFFDYILVDDFIVPPDQQPYFDERLVHLPGCYQVNDSRREISPHTPSRADCGLPEEGFVFCSFNNSYKITSEVFGAWMRLLQAVPGSALWLLAGHPLANDNLRREAQARGVAPERLVFAPRVDSVDHLARHRLAGLFLDTFPVGAHTTASDALWAGCPLVTIAGPTFISRVAGSLLRALGLNELITTNLQQYESLALRLATQPEQLADVRSRLQANRATSSLFDAGKFASNVERAYVTMWENQASGQPPRAFRVEPAPAQEPPP